MLPIWAGCLHNVQHHGSWQVRVKYNITQTKFAHEFYCQNYPLYMYIQLSSIYYSYSIIWPCINSMVYEGNGKRISHYRDSRIYFQATPLFRSLFDSIVFQFGLTPSEKRDALRCPKEPLKIDSKQLQCVQKPLAVLHHSPHKPLINNTAVGRSYCPGQPVWAVKQLKFGLDA